MTHLLRFSRFRSFPRPFSRPRLQPHAWARSNDRKIALFSSKNENEQDAAAASDKVIVDLLSSSTRHHLMGDMEAAEADARSAMQAIEALPHVHQHEQLVDCASFLGKILLRDKPAEAAVWFERAYECLKREKGDANGATASALVMLARANELNGEYEEAEKMNRVALGHLEATAGWDFGSTNRAASGLVTLLMRNNNVDEALAVARRANAGVREAVGPDDPRSLVNLNSLANLLIDLEKKSEAEEILKGAGSVSPRHPLFVQLFQTRERLKELQQSA